MIEKKIINKLNFIIKEKAYWKTAINVKTKKISQIIK